jgi:hypothetical protein
MVWEATGTAEHDTALLMLERIPGNRRVTVAGDKSFDTADFISECRQMQMTPHLAQNHGRPGGCAIDQQTTPGRLNYLNLPSILHTRSLIRSRSLTKT